MIQSLKPERGMVIAQSVRFLPGEYDFTQSEGLIIAADDIVIDGNGAMLRGGCTPQKAAADANIKEFGYGLADNPDNAHELGYWGIGLRVEGHSRVTIMNLTLTGFDIGVLVDGCREITLINCNLSGCFHDPAWGWDEHGEHGAFVLRSSDCCRILNCRANNVWDALNMRHCSDCLICGCDFSHTSDTGLKLWHSCRNQIVNCDFSYGIRIDPGEVHARDSSSVLIESGSDDNWFFGNDMSHGGDGLFIRVLNGWMSCRNTFVNNDCSYANNNAIEAWADYNTYIGNKASYSSYGFWLGNSDYTVVEDNEVAFNGHAQWHNNAPEAFGNAGIAIVNGSGSHSVIRNNYIHDNCGPGIAIRNTLENPSRHWIIEGNTFENNRDVGRYRGHGIYLHHVRLITLQDNHFSGNDGLDVCYDGNVADVCELPAVDAPHCQPPKLWTESISLRAGQTFVLHADAPVYWDFGDGTTAYGASVEHVYEAAGLYPVCATMYRSGRASLAGMTLQILPSDFYPLDVVVSCTDACVSEVDGVWEISAENGREHQINLCLKKPVKVTESSSLAAHLAYFSDADVDWNKETRYPKIKLVGAGGGSIELNPTVPLIEMCHAPRSEMRGEGRVLVCPLKGCAEMTATMKGSGLDGGLVRIELLYGGMSDSHSRLIIRALGLCAEPETREEFKDITVDACPEWEGEMISGDAAAILGISAPCCCDIIPRVRFSDRGALAAVFPVERTVDRVECVFYAACLPTKNSSGEVLPSECVLEALIDGEWSAVDCASAAPMANRATKFSFSPILCAGIRVRFDGPACIARLAAFNTAAICGVRALAETGLNAVDAVEVKLNKELNGNGSPLGDLTARVFALDEEEHLTDCLFETIVSRDDIIPYVPLRIATKGLMLNEGKKYALALGQTNLAKSRTEGDYYRWIGGRVDCSETFAIYTGGESKPSDYDWGTAWLRVVAGEARTELTHHSEHVGTRFGIEDMECRYQTFRAPIRTSVLTDGCVSGEGFMLRGTVVLKLPDSMMVEAVDVYLSRAAQGRIVLKDGNGRELCVAENPQAGRVRLHAQASMVQELQLCADEAVLTEAEVIRWT